MEYEVIFGQVLRRLRNFKGLSQEELASQCGLDRTFISLLERGKRKPTITTIFVIAKNLDIKASNLIKEVENEIDK